MSRRSLHHTATETAERFSVALWLLFFVLVAQPAAACTVCMGAPGDPLVEGANRGIWVLLAVIFFVQVAFVALFVMFWKRARQLKRFREQFKVVQGGSQ